MDRPAVTILELPSGLRAAVCSRTGATAEYVGVVVHAGSRNDPADRPGLAHFVEHTIFKGTLRRRSWHILNCMETRGGELNAYTTKEETVIYTAAPAGNARRAVDLIADLVINSQFPAAELAKERQVVADEIDSYLDNPAEAVFDDFDELLFADTSLSHNILGTAEALAAFTPADCLEFITRHYRPDNMVLFYDGPLTAKQVERLVARAFVWEKVAPAAVSTSVPETWTDRTFDTVRSADSHQCHTIVGARIPGMYSDRRFAISLLNNILGGPCMNSRLNLALRERRGLVYSVDSSLNMYTDIGSLTIYFGCDKADLGRCRRLVFNELQRATDAMSERTLARCIEQYCGQLILASESREQMAIGAARALLHYGRVNPVSMTIERLRALTPTAVAEAARIIAHPSVLTLG